MPIGGQSPALLPPAPGKFQSTFCLRGFACSGRFIRCLELCNTSPVATDLFDLGHLFEVNPGCSMSQKARPNNISQYG